MTSVGTLPSGLSARYSGERKSSFLNDMGLPSKATPTSCSAMCTAIELEPGAKYKVSMSRSLGSENALPLPLWERVGVRGSGLSIGRDPSPGSHLTMRSDLSHKGRGDIEQADAALLR